LRSARLVTGYTLAFGSLLLLGGRLAHLIGRKVTGVPQCVHAAVKYKTTWRGSAPTGLRRGGL
jgi:hypothetical protein